MKLGPYSHTWIIVYLNTDSDELVTVPCYGTDEAGVLNVMVWKGRQQVLKNLFKVDAYGNVTKFKDLQLEHKGLINKIRELTGK